MASSPVIIFDLGGVLIDWDPRHLYRKLFDDEKAMEIFLAEVCTPTWNAEQDRGRTWAEAVEILVKMRPDRRGLIEAYSERWEEMLGGPITGTVAILEQMKADGLELHALTNWSAETFPIARERFDFLKHFETILVSGEEKMMKPDPQIFHLMLERIGHPASSCLFIDDSWKNIEAARKIGIDAIHFETPAALKAALSERGL